MKMQIAFMESVSDRLRQARQGAGFESVADAARALGVSYPTYAGHENGSRGLRRDSLSKYARRFKVSVDWLLTGKGDKSEDPAEPARVPLISWVSAGSLAMPDYVPDGFDEVPYVYAPDLDPNGDWIALRVDGRSMDKISPHDSIIFVNRKERVLVPNALYIIGDNNGGATYKRFRPPNILEAVTTKPEDYPSITFTQEPDVIGRVRKTVLSL
jgi:SOS-response transcriptional repressor LexA